MGMINPEIYTVLEKMCDTAGVKAADIDFLDTKSPYYLQVQWSREQETEFTKWLTEEIVSNGKLRAAFSQYPNLYKAQKHASRLANGFVFQYGFKLTK